MPLDQKSATILRIDQEKIRHSASLAAVRGDLWAESAFAYGGQLWVDQAMELDPGDRLTFKRSSQPLSVSSVRASSRRCLADVGGHDDSTQFESLSDRSVAQNVVLHGPQSK